MEVFLLIPENKHKFVTLVQETLKSTYVSVKTLQRLVGKCTSFSRAVPAVRLFTREMNAAIFKDTRSQKPILPRGALREEISHWLFLETYDNPLPWRDQRHIPVSVAKDARGGGGGSVPLNNALKVLLVTTAELNVLLRFSYVRSAENLADGPSRHLSPLDYRLTDTMWQRVEQEFGFSSGRTFDLMALDSNVMKDRFGNSLPHFTLSPFAGSSGVNLFVQDLPKLSSRMHRPYVFPPSFLVGSFLRFLRQMEQSCAVVVLDVYPRKYWWPLLQYSARKALKMAARGDPDVLLVPSRQGWVPHSGIPGDLCVFSVEF